MGDKFEEVYVWRSENNRGKREQGSYIFVNINADS